jgi:sugar/nucleoside kinase (ribokinase family)
MLRGYLMKLAMSELIEGQLPGSKEVMDRGYLTLFFSYLNLLCSRREYLFKEEETISHPLVETVSSYIEKESLAAYAAKKADDLGINLMVQYTPFTAQYPLEEMKSIKIFVISDEDLRDLTGFYPDNTEKALRALVMLSSKIQSKYYIIQRGDDSVFVYDGTHYEIVFAPEILRKDTREIGVKMKPSFIGALAAEYLDSKNIIRACRFAIIVSLLTRTKFGNLEKLMSRSELVQYVTERGIKLFG